MAFFKWQAALDTGFETIDNQHHKLLDMINGLHEAMSTGQGKDAVATLVEDMIDYTATHFKLEEEYMLKYDFEGYAEHKQQHTDFVSKVVNFKQDLLEGKQVLSSELMHFLKDWLFQHIAKTDKKYISLFKEKGV